MAGFTGVYGSSNVDVNSVEAASRLTGYSSHTKFTRVHQEPQLVIQKSSLDFMELPGMTVHANDVSVWIDGEIYNHEALRSQEGETLAQTFLNSYFSSTLGEVLQKADGVFIILIYDSRQQKLLMISDRYGLKPFYVSTSSNCLTFAPELKCFAAIKSFELKIRKDVIDCFIQLEHLLGTVTWFEGVDLIKPASIYTYSVRDHTLQTTQYWSWGKITRSAISFNEAAEQMGNLLEAANKKRFYGNYQVGVALSGGLDSRAILAAVYQQKPITYTFGLEDSQDVIVARQVAQQAHVEHFYFDIRTDHWLDHRFGGIWKTDGMLNMYHMHYSHLMTRISEIMSVNLSGFLGDVVLGGSYMDKKGQTFLNKRMDRSLAEFFYGKYAELCDPTDSFFDIDKIDPYVMYNRGRRMIGMGAEEPNKTILQRLPFMDLALTDFAYSLPDNFRVHSKLYDKALLLKYPEFYRNIPNATTRVPIREHSSVFLKARKGYYRGLEMVKYKLGMATSYTDVYNWIKEPAAAKRIGEILNPAHAIYPNFTFRNFKHEFLDPHVQGKGNFMKQVMGALTLEVWLQQVLNKKYISANP